MVRSSKATTAFEGAHESYAKYQGKLDEKPPEYVFMAGYIAALHQMALDVRAAYMENGLDFRPHSDLAQYLEHFRRSVLAGAKRIADSSETLLQPKEPE